MATSTDIGLPPGFVLDPPKTQTNQGAQLPPGFVLDNPSQTSTATSTAGAVARGAGTAVVPAFGARGGAVAGAELGALIPGLGETGIGEIGGGIVGAIVGSILGDKAQKAVLKKVAPEAHDQLEQYQQEDLKDHPIASAIGGLAGGIPAFKLQNPLAAARSVSALIKIAKGTAVTDIEKQAARNLATQIGLGTGLGVVGPIIQGQKPTAGDITQSIAQMLLFGEPRKFGEKPQTPGESNAGPKPGPAGLSKPEIRPSVGEGTPLRQQGETPQTSPPEAQGANEPPAPGGGETGKSGDETKITPQDLQPALMFDGKPVTGGDTHAEILAKQSLDRMSEYLDDPKRSQRHVFVDKTGKIYNRVEAAKALGLDEPLQSEVLNDLKAAGPPLAMAAAPQDLGADIRRPKPDFGTTGAGRDIHGTAQRVLEARAHAEQISPILPGQGVNARQTIEMGQELLANGFDVEGAMKRFEETGEFSPQLMMAARAHGARLTRAAQRAELNGTDSDEYRIARAGLDQWEQRAKKLATASHKNFVALQGETDVDTGTFTGLERQFQSAEGKVFDDSQTKVAKKKAGAVRDAAEDVVDAKHEVNQRIVDETEQLSPEEQHLQDQYEREFEAERDKEQADLTEAEQAQNEADQKERLAKVQEDAAMRALKAAWKTVREAAAARATMETKERVGAQERSNKTADVQARAAARAKRLADDQARRNAARKAKDEAQARVDQAKKVRQAAEVQARATREALKRVAEVARRNATKRAAQETQDRILKANKSRYIWKKAKEYIDLGVDDFNDLRNKLATDLGMPVNKVTEYLSQSKAVKRAADDLWIKQNTYRRLHQEAKDWVKGAAVPGYLKQIQGVPRLLFGLKVGFHGTVALGTHAPAVAFQPRFWKAYFTDFVKMYKMVGSKAYYEMQVQDLVRRKNYVTARRAGLVNDPYQYEDYNSPAVVKWINSIIGAMGNRGYSVLKILRQDMFDQMWEKLPSSAQLPEVAQALADGINHATGVVKVKAPPGAAVALFAPRLELSRGAWLVTDPIRAVKTFVNWNNSTTAEKVFAVNQAKEKAWVMGTLLGLLAMNQGFLAASGSQQQINFDNPLQSDWLKFKASGMDFAYGNALLSMARLPARLYQIRESKGGKLSKVIYPDENSYSALGEYARSQLSPFASLVSTLWFKGDWQNRPLPDSEHPVPKRLKAEGVTPYTWPEFWSEQALPIPFEEATREVWQQGLGMNPEQLKNAGKSLLTLAVMSATGARLTDDVPPKHNFNFNQ